jgi:AcrR family transcriptional regulator
MAAPGVRTPVQERSRASLERVLAVGCRLLAEKGYDGFTIPELSRKARVSPGLIYGRFENKDALFQAIHDRELDRIAAEHPIFADEPIAGEDLDAVVAAVIGDVSEIFRREAPLLRIFLSRGGVDPVVTVRGAQWIGLLNERMCATLLTRRDEIGHPDPQLAARACSQIVVSFLLQTVQIDRIPTELEVTRPRNDARAELPLMCRAYLRGSGVR